MVRFVVLPYFDLGLAVAMYQSLRYDSVCESSERNRLIPSRFSPGILSPFKLLHECYTHRNPSHNQNVIIITNITNKNLWRTLSTILYCHVQIILLDPLPETAQWNKYIVTCTDYFSKWPKATPLPDKTATGVADFLFSVFCRHGWPETIISDQGREFVNAVTRFVNAIRNFRGKPEQVVLKKECVIYKYTVYSKHS